MNSRLHLASALVRVTSTFLALLVAGCATQPTSHHIASTDLPARECVAWLTALDTRVAGANVYDAEAARIASFPYLRVNRLLASLSGRIRSDQTKVNAWLDAMRQLDREAREVEISNLPQAEIAAVGMDRDTLRQHTDACASLLLLHDRTDEKIVGEILSSAKVADNYSTAKRVLGAYALTSKPFFAGVTRWQDDTTKEFSQERNVAFDSEKHVRYFPPVAAISNPNFTPAKAVIGPLGIAALSSQQENDLLHAYAPILEVEKAGDDNRIGRVELSSMGAKINTSLPTVYARVSHMPFDGEILTQLVYTAWFPRRPAEQAFDLLSGELDGVIIRVTLDQDGQILLLDSIHACGCYHEFFPSSRLIVRPPPNENEEWAFVPTALTRQSPDTRLTVRLARDTHYLTRVTFERLNDGIPYALERESALRSLPFEGGHRSLYRPDGLIGGSERGERWLFWPMGIASPGAMRQWGHHATAFVGRRHFDDADLLDARFARR